MVAADIPLLVDGGHCQLSVDSYPSARRVEEYQRGDRSFRSLPDAVTGSSRGQDGRMSDQPTGASAGDRTVLEHIDELVAEEKALRAQHAGRRLGDDDRARLAHLEVQLDQAWDLLRQRRAREEQHAGLSDVHERPEREVEGYLQ